MAFLLLLFLVCTSLLPWSEPLVGSGLYPSLLAAAGVPILSALSAILIARSTRRRLRADPGNREEILNRYGRIRFIHFLGLMSAHLLILAVFGWGWAVRIICGADISDEPPFGPELLQMLPFMSGLILGWAGFYGAERAAYEVSGGQGEGPFGGRWGYVGFLARQNLALVCVPLGLFLTEQAVLRTWPDLAQSAWMRLGMFGLVFVALAIAPWPLRLILCTSPLPAGPLRGRLIAAAQRLRCRYSNILLWHTRHGVANAMVAGPLPWVRYVFLSDRLLDELDPDEVEAVFGHEVGHVRHGHILYYMLFVFLSLTTLVGAWAVGRHLLGIWAVNHNLIPVDAEPQGWWATFVKWESVPMLGLVGTYMFVVFGFLSRRCERQADLFGCRAVSCSANNCDGHAPGDPLAPAGTGLCPTGIRTFIRALDKVAVVNGISRGKPGLLSSWLHGSIARRVEFLERVLTDRSLEASFQRRIGLTKWLLVGGLVATLGLLATAGYWEQISSVL